jgi:hypothetical protein
MPSSPGPVRIGIRSVAPVSLVTPQPATGAIAYDRVLWFTGEGAPPSASAIGAKTGDMYLDTLTDDIYLLEA